eukprot:TRINITY_DN5502_c2_g1_i1.p1 TRINITY_DN5502_c2_g1~~TRINITY_DN5502_c2_g1_i1.p1  ORF type:complete len:297 (+),score=72.05 TRINITY_DN5502_c2_g1_i1:80-970(+)
MATADSEPLLKRQKVEPDAKAEAKPADDAKDTFEARVKTALHDYSRDELLQHVFNAWDRDGNGSLSFEEILPHYMKSAQHHNLLEPTVRSGFESFMAAEGRKAEDGISLALFKRWLSKLTDEQVAAHYVRHVQGWTSSPYRMNVHHAVVKAYHHKSLQEILDSPIHALRGLSELGEGALAPLGLHRVRDLANWKIFHLARAICVLADREDVKDSQTPSEDPAEVGHHVNIRNALTKEHEGEPLKHLLDLPVSSLSIFPDQGDEALEHLRVKTIRHLGTRKYFKWAQAMQELEKFEA